MAATQPTMDGDGHLGAVPPPPHTHAHAHDVSRSCNKKRGLRWVQGWLSPTKWRSNARFLQGSSTKQDHGHASGRHSTNDRRLGHLPLILVPPSVTLDWPAMEKEELDGFVDGSCQPSGHRALQDQQAERPPLNQQQAGWSRASSLVPLHDAGVSCNGEEDSDGFKDGCHQPSGPQVLAACKE